MRTFFFVGLMMIIGCVLMTACSNKHKLEGASRTTPLSSDAWNASEWISVVDAPVVTGKVTNDKNNRSADGANWMFRL